MTTDERATLLKKTLQAQFVNPMKEDEYHDVFVVSGKGFVLLVMVYKKTNRCSVHNAMSGSLLKEFTLKEGGEE